MISIKSLIGSTCLLFLSISLKAQNSESIKYTSSNKGKFFISWGGNRESYSKSDITFKGSDYNFTLKDVKAHDVPKGWHIDYINPTRLTIPQTNYKIGYFISDHYAISIGVDHMKYVVTGNQFATINGSINLAATETGAQFNGSYNDTAIQLTEDFLQFEHTDGLNYIHSEFSRIDDISSIFKLTNTDKFQLNITEGIGAGILYPKTNATLLSKERYDDFHVSGYGLSFKAGLNFIFFKHYFIQGDLKGGYINMNNIKTTSNDSDSASQSFFYFQRIISFGGVFRI